MNPVGKGQKRNNGQHDKDASPVSVIGKKEQRKEAKPPKTVGKKTELYSSFNCRKAAPQNSTSQSSPS